MLTNVVDTNATRVAVAESPRRVGKRLFYAPTDNPTDAWRPDDERAGKWVKPKDIGQGADTNIGKNYQWRLYDTDTHAQRIALRKLVASDVHKCMILGLPNEENLARFTPQADHLLCPYGQFTRGKSAFRDTPRAWLTMDVDGLDLRKIDADVDVHADADRMQDLLRDALDDMGLDWLIADCIIQFSSTHGLHSTHHLKAHVEWRLAQPLTVAQQKLVAGYCNTQATSKGYGTPFDTTIYDINRIFFTAPPELLKRVWVPDQGMRNEPVPHPYKGERVLRSEQGIEWLDLTDNVRALFDRADKLQRVRTLTHVPGVRLPSGPRVSLSPGHVHEHIRNLSFRTVRTTPRHKLEAARERLRLRLIADIEAMPDAAPDKTDARLAEYLGVDTFGRYWLGAVEKRQYYGIADAPPQRPLPYARDARAAVASTFAAMVEDGIAFAKSAPEPDQLLQERPRHTLVRIPPGVGKTEAALGALTIPHLSMHRIGYYAPTMRLSEEATARKRNTAPAELVRHHAGRKHLCTNDDLGPIAELYEDAGLSPRKFVCANCPVRDECGWIAQREDIASGLVIMQHAHITSSLSRLTANSDAAPDVNIIDESLLGTLLHQRQAARSFASLRRETKRASIKGASGHTLHGVIEDLIAYRTKTLDMLEQYQHTVPTEAARRFWRFAKNAEGQCDATRLERRLRSTAEDTLELLAKQPATHANKRRIGRLTTAILVSRWFQDMYYALRVHADMSEREHVFGVRISGTKRKKVALNTRERLPPTIAHRHGIWLDGTANPSVWRAFLGQENIEVAHFPLQVAPGPYRLTQFADMAYGKAMFINPQRPSSARTNLARLRRFILSLAVRHTRVLVVTQLALEELLDLPPNVATEHFNNLRGLDQYKHYPCAVIVGRPAPQISDLVALAEALHFDNPAVARIDPSRPQRPTRPLRMADGCLAHVPCESYADPHLEALREQISDAEVQQALNRLRLYDRTDTNPAEIYVFGQADTGLPVHQFAQWIDAERDNADIIAAGGVWSSSHELMGKLAFGLLDGYAADTFERLAIPDYVLDWPNWLIAVPWSRYRVRVWADPALIAQDVESVKRAVFTRTGIEVS